MAVASNASKIQYNCDGVTKAFAFTFNAAASSEVLVILTDANDTETVLTETTDYVVSETNNDFTNGGTVTTDSAYAAGNTITIMRNVGVTQESSFYESQPTLYGTFEDALDHLSRVDQQLNEKLSRAPLLPKSATLSNPVLPLPEGSKYIGWNPTGTALQNSSAPSQTTVGATNVKYLSNYADFATALSSIGGTTTTLVVDTTATVSVDTTTPSTLLMICTNMGAFSVATGKTLTISGPFVAGNYQIFSGTGAVKLSGPVKIEWFGFLTSATGAVNYAAVVAALATGSTDISATVAGDYTYDNSSITTISTAKLQLKLARGVNIKPSSSTTSVFRITGAGIKFSGGTITGTGTYVTTGSSTGRPISFIEVTDDEDADGTVTLGYRQDNEIENVLMVNPNNCGILFYRTVGGKAKGNKITSAYDDVWQQGQFGIDTSSSAQIEISNNFLDGHIQDIVGGGTTRYTFDDYSGTAAGSNVRDILITGNTMTNFRDHAVYYSSDCERITVTSNQMRSQYASSNEAIKLAYSGNVVVGNHYEGVGGGFHGRSLSKSVVSANRFVVTGESGYIFPIYIEAPTTIDLHLEGITITDNYVEATGASGCGSGIYFLAQNRDSDGSQNIIKNIIIKGNYLKNVGGNTGAGGTYRSGILMLTEKHNTPASSIFGEDIIISGNQLECSTSALYGIAMSLTTSYSAYKNVIIKDNIISGVVTNVMYLSIKNSIVKDNHFTAGIAAANGIREFAQTDTLCSNNYYGLLHSVYGTDIAARHYLELGSSDSIFDQNYTYYNNNLGISGIVFAAGSPWTSIIVNPTAGDTPITLLSYAHINYNVGRIVTVKNLSASNKLTFELSSGGATVDIAATATKSFICIGSNTFVEL
jgi:hypothetical protein